MKVVLSISLLTFALGCSPRSEFDDQTWYDDSRSTKEKREAFVGDQMDTGLSEFDAKKAWEFDRMMGKTHGSWDKSQVVPVDEVLGHNSP